MKFLPNINKNTKTFFIAAVITDVVLILLLVALIFFVSGKNKAISVVADEISKEAYKKEQLLSIRSLLRGTKNERARLDTYFITGDSVVDFIEQLESMGRNTGVSIELRSVDVVPEEDGEMLRVSFTTDGSWNSTVHMFALVEYFPANIIIDRANILKVTVVKNNKAQSFWRGDYIIEVKSFL